MTVWQDLFSSFGGWLVVAIGFIMFIGFPYVFWRAFTHPSISPAEKAYLGAHHPVNDQQSL